MTPAEVSELVDFAAGPGWWCAAAVKWVGDQELADETIESLIQKCPHPEWVLYATRCVEGEVFPPSFVENAEIWLAKALCLDVAALFPHADDESGWQSVAMSLDLPPLSEQSTEAQEAWLRALDGNIKFLAERVREWMREET